MTIENLKETANNLQDQAINKINQTSDIDQLENLRVHYLGKNGLITNLMQQLKSFSLEDKKELGPLFNNLKIIITQELEAKNQQLLKAKIDEENAAQANFDVTAYVKQNHGSLHILSQEIDFAEDIFISMGFKIAKGPEIETDINNFEALNIPKNHPARDMQDTFWLTIPSLLMRTHTSSVAVNVMKNQTPPIAIVAPGRCFRNEATDATHDFMFMQLEGLFIDKHASISNLASTLKNFLQAFFEKKDISIRMRPSYYPFVEPGLDIDMSCPFCEKGCNTCKNTKWIEVAGAGLTHPNVLTACKIDPNQYSGFAFGFGLTRLIMLKYNISDIRLLHSNKIDFLKQF